MAPARLSSAFAFPHRILNSTSELFAVGVRKFPVDMVSSSLLEVITVAQKFENTMQPVLGLGFHSSAIEDVDHDAYTTWTLGWCLATTVILSCSMTRVLALM